jgi:RimJ/RimL family protein N-acetyltransferase
MGHGTTERLVLEPLAPSHAAGLFAALDDDRVGRYIGGPDVTSLPALRERIERLRVGPPPGRDELWCNWAVLAGRTVIGRIEATIHDDIAELAYVFGPAWWGRGYATEAVAWMIGEVGSRGTSECWATVTPGNDASVRVLERTGFQPAAPGDRRLLSYEPGDLTYRRV